MRTTLARLPALGLIHAVIAQVPTVRSESQHCHIPSVKQCRLMIVAKVRLQTYYVDDSLPNHTLFHPEDLSSFDSIPVVVWGNGACSADPVGGHGPFLEELAAWGILVIASGTPGGQGSTSPEMMTEAIDWAVQNAGQGNWANIDGSSIAAAGMSCGGTEAYAQNQDDRVSAFGIFNSGTLDPSQTDQTLGAINVPIFFFLGGPSDIAYENVSSSRLLY